jgi:hypothetical protein
MTNTSDANDGNGKLCNTEASHCRMPFLKLHHVILWQWCNMLSPLMYLNFFHHLAYLKRKMLLKCICKKSSDIWAMFCYKDSNRRARNDMSSGEWFQTLKARFAHSMLCPCHAHAIPLPCSDSSVSFMKVRVAVRNIRTASATVQQIVFFVVCCYHSLQS